MAKITNARMTAHIEGDFVVFLIGMRINEIWKVHKWVPVIQAMFKMLKELSLQSDLGLLGFRILWGGRNFELIQYWRSFETLHAYARNQDAEHLPAWLNFNQQIADNGSVGIWHESYLVNEGQHQSVYRNMPPYGLAAASTLVPAVGERKTASGRLGRSDGQDSPLTESGG